MLVSKIRVKRKRLGFRLETNVLCISGKKIYGCGQDLSGYGIVADVKGVMKTRVP